MTKNRSNIIISVFLFTLSIVVYLKTLCPTVYSGDSGELITAAYCLGIAHPPGYPLYTLLGRLFIGMPFGSVAFRMNLMSAVFSAVTVVLVYLIILQFTGKIKTSSTLPAGGIFRKIAAITGALMLAFSGKFWPGAVTAEVFSLNACFLALLILLLLKWDGRLNSYLYLIGFLLGLSFTNHITIVLALPGFLYYIWIKSKQERKEAGKNTLNALMFFIAFVLLGALLYLYLPVRAANSPVMNWGNPDNFRRFIKVITRSQYGTLKLHSELGALPSIGTAARQVYTFVYSLIKQFGIIGFILGILGMFKLFKDYRREFYFLLITFLLSGIGFLIYANMPLIPMFLDMSARFYIMPGVVFSVWLGAGILFLSGLIKNKLAYALVFLPLILLTGNYHESDRSRNWIAYDHALNTLKTLEKDSILFILGDDFVFPMAYLKVVEKRRPDVEVYEAFGNVFKNIYGKHTGSEAGRMKVRTEFANSTDRPVWFTKDIDTGGLTVKPVGILFRVIRDGEIWQERREVWDSYNMRGVYDDKLYKDYRSRIISLRYPFLRAEYYKQKNDTDNAILSYRKACRAGRDVEGVFLDLGNIYYNNGRNREAMAAYDESVRINTGYASGYNGKGLVYNNKKEWDRAIEQFLLAVKHEPDFASGYNNMGIAYFRKGLVNESLKMFEKAMKIDPECSDAIVNYNTIRNFLSKGGK